MGTHSWAAGQAEDPAGWRPPAAPLGLSLTPLLTRHWVSQLLLPSHPSGCSAAKEEEEEVLTMATMQEAAGQEAGMAEGEAAKDAGGGGGGVWRQCLGQ